MRHAAQDVVGSWIVFDPTGRDYAPCMEAGQVTECYFSADDDGDRLGRPRPLMAVRSPAETEADIAVTVVHAVYPSEAEAVAAARAMRTGAELVRLGRDLADFADRLEATPHVFGREDAVAHLQHAGDSIDTAIGALMPGEFNVPDDRFDSCGSRIVVADDPAPCGCTDEPCPAHHPDTMETAKQKPGPLEDLAEVAQLASLARTALDDPGAIAFLDLDDDKAQRAYAIDRLDDIIGRARDAGAIED